MTLWHLTTENYSREGRAIEGTIPCIRTPIANVLVSSLGGSRQDCEALATHIHALPDVARAMLAALEEIARPNMQEPDEREWDSMEDAYNNGAELERWDIAQLARRAIAAAKAAGIGE